MINNFKTLVETLEEMKTIEAFEENSEMIRLRILKDIESRLNLNTEEHNMLINDINDVAYICKEDGFYIGLYYGFKLSKIIEKI